jgi:transcriptional regulator with XRE-family HTH domain
MPGLHARSFHRIRNYLQQDGILGRLSKDDLAFYDGIAERIRDLLGDSRRGMSVATLAGYIGWSCSSLSNFLNRRNQTIPTHLLAKAAKALHVPASYLMMGE